MRGYGTDWRKLRAIVLARDGYACVQVVGTLDGGPALCGELATHVDHVVPKSRGGIDDTSNLRSLCSVHHGAKTAREGRRAR